MPVDIENRRIFGGLIRQLADCQITNDQFEERYNNDFGWVRRPSKAPEQDPIFYVVKCHVWFLYSDLTEHKLTDISSDERAFLERIICFLDTDLEYEWPVDDPSQVGRLFIFFCALVTFRWYLKRRHDRYWRNGDADVWPFFRREDYVKHTDTKRVGTE